MEIILSLVQGWWKQSQKQCDITKNKIVKNVQYICQSNMESLFKE
jgi:hypothetical protein